MIVNLNDDLRIKSYPNRSLLINNRLMKISNIFLLTSIKGFEGIKNEPLTQSHSFIVIIVIVLVILDNGYDLFLVI